jgi:hypothetical protein
VYPVTSNSDDTDGDNGEYDGIVKAGVGKRVGNSVGLALVSLIVGTRTDGSEVKVEAEVEVGVGVGVGGRKGTSGELSSFLHSAWKFPIQFQTV